MKYEKEIYNSMYEKLVNTEGMEKSEEIVDALKYIIEENDSKVHTFVYFQQEVINRYMELYEELLHEYNKLWYENNKLWYNFLFVTAIALFLLGINVYHLIKIFL